MNTKYITFLRWLFLVIITIFGILVIDHFGFLSKVFYYDPTSLTWIISTIFVVMTGYCGYRTFNVSSELATLDKIKQTVGQDVEVIPDPGSLVWLHTKDLATIQNHNSLINYDQATLLNYRSSQYHDKHEIIWHVAEGLVTLGLVGTVIGFIMALWPMFTLTDFSFDAVKGLLGDISGGIAVALFTTLTGLITSVILRMQAQFLETSTNTLISELAHVSETHIIPVLISQKGQS